MSGTVFLSGSRKIMRLNDQIRDRLDNVLAKQLHVVVGDANGADKAVQAYLAKKAYPSVTVYCAKGRCRNNLGQWEQKSVPVPPGLSGRDFYAQKDVAMAEDADYGLVLWDGKSIGSINNVVELLKRGKVVVVYLSPKRAFATLKYSSDLAHLLEECDPDDREALRKRVPLDRTQREIGVGRQQTLELG